MLDSIQNFLPLADIQVQPGFKIACAVPGWILVPGAIAVSVMIYYLYRAQRQIASRKIIAWLTALRIALIVLISVLLLRPMLTLRRTEKARQTLWIVLDQSLSMAQTDPQATPIEHLRWADALGLMPSDVRPSKLDQAAARLSALHDDLLQIQVQNRLSANDEETARTAEEFVGSLKNWSADLADVIGRLEKDPKLQIGDAASMTRDLHDAADKFTAGVAQAAQRKSAAEGSADIPWARTGDALETILFKLKPLAAQSDAAFLSQHGNDSAVHDAMTKVATLRRADLAYLALTGKARELTKSMADVLDREDTRVVTFAGTQQIVATANKTEIPKTLLAALEPTGTSTNLNDALKFVSDQISQNEQASVLVVSDGRSNDGGDPTNAARRLASRGVRVYTLGVGSHETAVDAAVDSVDAPEWIYKDDTLKASALIRLDGLANQRVNIEFRRGDTVIDTHAYTPASANDTHVENFHDKPPESGVFGYSIHIEEMPREVVKENNTQGFRVMVKDDKLHVILVQDQPRWEDRYLANYLKRDQRVQLQQVWCEPAQIAGISAPEPVKASPTNKSDVAQLLPATAAEWSAFDLIVLGDVPPESLSPQAQKNIAAAVRERGSALMIIAGQLNMPGRYAGSPLEELIPVHLASNWTAAALNDHLQHGFRAAVAPEGANTPFSQFDLEEKKNAEYWGSMGSKDNRWYWHSEQTLAKQSASVLWQIGELHPNADEDVDALATARQRALLLTMPIGMGRVLYLGSEETWRMRHVDLPDDRQGTNLHERFWGQVIRWLAQSDLPAGGKFVRFGTSKAHYAAGDPVVVTIRLLKEDFTPWTGEHFKVVAREVVQKDAKTGDMRGGQIIAVADAAEMTESPGIYRATMNGVKTGGIEVSLEGALVEKALNEDAAANQKTLLVDIFGGTELELRNVNPDPNALARVAQAGNGVAADIAYADVFGERIPDRTHPRDSIQQIGLFTDPHDKTTRLAHWVFLAVFVGLITTEWIVRKVGGLV